MIAETPDKVPLCVIDFAHIALRMIRLERRLELFEVYYRQAFNEESGTSLTIEKGNEAELGELWDLFIRERRE